MAEDLDQIQKFKIKDRESWFKMIILSAFSVVIISKLVGGSFRVDLSELSFTDVLSLFLALFSIGISVAFYFKATDTSNEFYNNNYRFTQEMSKILAKIDSGFTEQLKNIHETQSHMADKLENWGSSDNPRTKSSLEKENPVELK